MCTIKGNTHIALIFGKDCLKLLSLTFWLCFLPLQALANWQLGPGSEIFDGTISAYGVTDRGIGGLGVQCQDGRVLLWTQGWAPSSTGPDRQESFRVIVDEQSYSITGHHSPPDGLWTGAPPPALIDALKAGSTAVVATQSAGSVSVSLRRSSRAIASVLSDCRIAAATDSASGPGRNVALFDQLITDMCGGGYNISDGAEMTGLLDDDDQPDLVLDWAGVTCDDQTKGRGAGLCGAALCTIEVSLTQTQSRQQMQGLNPEIVARAFGAQALKTTTQGKTCGGGAQTCDVFWIWNGTELKARR